MGWIPKNKEFERCAETKKEDLQGYACGPYAVCCKRAVFLTQSYSFSTPEASFFASLGLRFSILDSKERISEFIKYANKSHT